MLCCVFVRICGGGGALSISMSMYTKCVCELICVCSFYLWIILVVSNCLELCLCEPCFVSMCVRAYTCVYEMSLCSLCLYLCLCL